jgi:aspartate-semialdehyde dehydrogenase
MDPTKTYCSEINASELTAADKIIANPNCSTIQMVLVLAPLHRKYNIKRVVSVPIHHWNRRKSRTTTRK